MWGYWNKQPAAKTNKGSMKSLDLLFPLLPPASDAKGTECGLMDFVPLPFCLFFNFISASNNVV